MSGRAGRYKTYSVAALEKAIRFVKETGGSIKLAAREFGVPPSTINDHLKKREKSEESAALKIKNEIESTKTKKDKGLLKIPVVPKAKPSDTEEVNGQKSSPRKRRFPKETNSQQSLSEVEDDVKDCDEVVKTEDDRESFIKAIVPNLSKTKTIKASPEHIPDPISHNEPTDLDKHGNDGFKRKKYSKEKLFAAYEYLLTNPTESITMVARKFGVPTTTLRDRWTGRVRVSHPTNFRPILPKPEIPSGQVHPVCLEKVNSEWNAIDKLIRCQSAAASPCQSDQNVCISYTNTLNDGVSVQCSAGSPVLSPVPNTTLQNNMSHIQVMASQPVGSSPVTSNLSEKSSLPENGGDGKQSQLVSDGQKRQKHSQELPSVKGEQGTEDRKSGVVMFNDIKIKQEPGVVDLSQVSFIDEKDIKVEDGHWDYTESSSDGFRNLKHNKKKNDRTLTVRLIYKNLQSKKKGRKSYKLYPKEALEKAIAFIRDEGGSPSKASEMFGVPQSTIGDRLRQMGIIRRPKHESRHRYNLWKTSLNKTHTQSSLEESSGNGEEDIDKSDADRSNVCLTTLASEITSFNVTDSGGNSINDLNHYDKDKGCVLEENEFQNGQSQDESDEQIEVTVPIEGSYVPSLVTENLGTDSNLSSQDSQNTLSLKSSDQEESSGFLSSSQADPSDDAKNKTDEQYKEGFRQNRYRKYSCFPVKDRVYKRKVRNKSPAASSNTQGVTKTRNYKNYTQESLQKACDYVMIWNKSVAEASRLYGVPCTTIWDKMHKQKSSVKPTGKSRSAGAIMEQIVQNQLVPKIVKDVNTRSTAEVVPSPVSDQSNENHENRVGCKSSKSRENWVETRLSWYLFDMAEIGYRFSEDEIIQIVSELRGDCCSNAWLCTLLDLYPALSNVLGGYNFSVTSCMVNFYYNKLDQLLEEKDLFKHPELVYMLDISCVVFEKNGARFVEAHRFTPSSLMVNDLDTEVVSVIGCANALGTALPPFFITPVNQPLSDRMYPNCPGAQSVTSDSGRCTTSKLLSYMKEHFCRFSQTGRGGYNVPVVILYNPYQAPVTLNLLTWAEDSNIHLFAIPPHTYSSSLEGGTSQLTSSDVGLFGSVYEDTLVSECNAPYSQVEVLTKAYKKTLVSDFVINRFINNGTLPVNLKRYSKLQEERFLGLDNRPPKVPFIKKEPIDFSECEAGTTPKDSQSHQNSLRMNNMAPATKVNSAAVNEIPSFPKDTVNGNIQMSTDNKMSPNELLGKKVSDLLQDNTQAHVPPKSTTGVHRRKRKGQPKQALHVKMFRNGNSIETYSLGKEIMQSDSTDNLCEKGESSGESTVATNQNKFGEQKTEEEVGMTKDDDIMTVAGYKIVLADNEDDDEEDLNI